MTCDLVSALSTVSTIRKLIVRALCRSDHARVVSSETLAIYVMTSHERVLRSLSRSQTMQIGRAYPHKPNQRHLMPPPQPLPNKPMLPTQGLPWHRALYPPLRMPAQRQLRSLTPYPRHSHLLWPLVVSLVSYTSPQLKSWSSLTFQEC
jgi:hypothetical protein